jgi:hypothetical protein
MQGGVVFWELLYNKKEDKNACWVHVLLAATKSGYSHLNGMSLLLDPYDPLECSSKTCEDLEGHGQPCKRMLAAMG